MGLTRDRRRRRRAAGDLLDLVALTPDGVGVMEDGSIVRALEVESLNPLVEDEARVEQLSRQLHAVNTRVPSGQSLMFYVQSSPLALRELIARETGYCTRAATAARRVGQVDDADAIQRLGFAETHSLLTHVPGVSASSLRFIVLCPWRPRRPVLPALRRPGARVTEVEEADLDEALDRSDRYASQIASTLRGADVGARRLRGPEMLDLLWARFSPNRADAGHLPPSMTHPHACGSLEAATSAEEATILAAHLREAICQEDVRRHGIAALEIGTPAEIAAADDADGCGGSLEQTYRLATVPEQTWLGWVMHLMRAPIPWTLAVHIHGTDRAKERRHQRARLRRLRGINRGTEHRGRDVDPEQEEREAESREVNAALATHAGSTVQRVGVYLALRARHDGEHRLDGEGETVAQELLANTDARLDPGRFVQHRSWFSTLPIGRDYLAGRARRYLSINAADTLPLVSTGCGSPPSPTWMPVGFGSLGRTLEGLDPFDPEHPNHVTLVAAQGGGGKTMFCNVLLSRSLAKGASGTVIERGGHYGTLAAAHPNGVVRKLGGRGGHALNPWDGAPDDAKLSFLLALHDLMIGEHAGIGDQSSLGVKRRSLLSIAIRAVYDRCSLSGETPRERILQEELHRRYVEARAAGSAELANDYQTLALSLTNYVGTGPYAWIADWLTTENDAPALEVWDTRDIPDAVSPAALFVICEKAVRRVEAQRARYLAGDRDGRPWDGRSFLVIDEAWKLLERPATGRWVNELALRSRHIALWFVAISQRLDHFATDEGKALISQASVKVFLRTSADQLPFIQATVGLTEEETRAIGELTTVKREYSTAFLMNGTRGRGTVTISVSDLEYWLATSDPVNDEPVRADALREVLARRAQSSTDRPSRGPSGEAPSHEELPAATRGGDGTTWEDVWSALKLLSDPAWHARRKERELAGDA